MKTRNFLSIAFMMAHSFMVLVIGSWLSNTGAVATAGIFMWLVMSFVASAFVWGIWNLEVRQRETQLMPKKAESVEKKKREHIDSVLRDLSDEDLLRLRRRLLDGTINDERLEDALVGEDGEMLYRERR